MIIDDIENQLQQSIDEHYESAIDQMLKNIK